MRPEALRPRAGGDHDLLADGDAALVGLDGRDAVVGAELEARHLGVRVDLHALGEALVAEAGDRLEVEGEAALVLVQADGHALRAPVGEELLHVRVDLGLAEVEVGAVADPLMALVDGREVALLHLRPERDVADAVVVVRLGVGLPDLDARLHQLAHRGLEVVVADDAAGDAGRARARGRLLEHDDVRARAAAALPELDGEVVGGREAVHAGADDDEAGRSGYHVNCLPGNGVSKSSRRRVPRPAPVNQPSATSPPSSGRSRCSTRSPTGGSSARTRSRAAPGSTRAPSRACSRRSPSARFVEHVPETGPLPALAAARRARQRRARPPRPARARPAAPAGARARDGRDGDAVGSRASTTPSPSTSRTAPPSCRASPSSAGRASATRRRPAR